MENKTPRYIDTNEPIRIYNRWIGQLQDPEDAGALEGVQSCLDVLMDQPIVDAAPVVHGRWLTTYTLDTWMGTSKIDGFICSECGKDSKVKGNYCPNCGAKMDLEE